jgi:hypothetical protein
VNTWLAKDVLPENWRQQLDEAFVEAMTKKISSSCSFGGNGLEIGIWVVGTQLLWMCAG